MRIPFPQSIEIETLGQENPNSREEPFQGGVTSDREREREREIPGGWGSTGMMTTDAWKVACGLSSGI